MGFKSIMQAADKQNVDLGKEGARVNGQTSLFQGQFVDTSSHGPLYPSYYGLKMYVQLQLGTRYSLKSTETFKKAGSL